jgi:hypothetical protein
MTPTDTGLHRQLYHIPEFFASERQGQIKL